MCKISNSIVPNLYSISNKKTFEIQAKKDFEIHTEKKMKFKEVTNRDLQ